MNAPFKNKMVFREEVGGIGGWRCVVLRVCARERRIDREQERTARREGSSADK